MGFYSYSNTKIQHYFSAPISFLPSSQARALSWVSNMQILLVLKPKLLPTFTRKSIDILSYLLLEVIRAVLKSSPKCLITLGRKTVAYHALDCISVRFSSFRLYIIFRYLYTITIL